MLVSDLFKVLDDTQDVDIYDRKTGTWVFCGESVYIPDSCMELHVIKLFINNSNNVLAIEVE